jgi:hypothetical protein
MILTFKQSEAIYKLYSSVICIRGDEAFDVNDNKIEYDIDSVNAKADELQAIEDSKKEQEIIAKESALSKLTALGLTTQEVKALLGIV